MLGRIGTEKRNEHRPQWVLVVAGEARGQAVWRSTHAWLALCGLCGCAGCAARARRRWKGCGRDMRTTRRRRHLHHHMLADGPRPPRPVQALLTLRSQLYALKYTADLDVE